MNTEELNKLKSEVSIVDVISKFTPLKRVGKLYQGLCVFHNDTKLGSFKVDDNKGTWKCYVCSKSGDSISFLTEMGNTFKKSVEMLRGKVEIEGEVIEKSTVERVAIADFSYIKPLEPVDPKNFIHARLGKPAHTYTYFTKDNELAGYVLRYEQNGEKYILPYNYGICIQAGWEYEFGGKGSGKYFEMGDIVHRYLGFGNKKPIYGVEKLSLYPKANVLILEGEKCADFVQERYDPKKVITLSPQGGTNSFDKCDWNVLLGRRIFLVEDNDDVSEKAFTYLAEELNNIAQEINRVRLKETTSKPKSWDLADEPTWNDKKITNYIKENLVS